MLFYAVWSRKGGRAGWTGSSRAENMIWISRIPGFAAHTTVPHTHQCTTHTTVPLHHKHRHHCHHYTTQTPVYHHTACSSLLRCPALTCIALLALSIALYCTAPQCNAAKDCKLYCIVASLSQFLHSICTICYTYKYLLSVSVFSASVV